MPKSCAFDLPPCEGVVHRLRISAADVCIEGYVLTQSVVGTRSDNARMVGHTVFDPRGLARMLYSDCCDKYALSVHVERVEHGLVVTAWVRRSGLWSRGQNVRYVLSFARVGSAVVYLQQDRLRCI